MTDDLSRAVGEANGKLDTLITLMRDHIVADERRFTLIDKTLEAHAKDINLAAGGKRAIILMASGVATLVSIGVAAAAVLLR